MKNHQLKRNLHREILVLKAQAYRTEIRQQACNIASVFAPARNEQAPSWLDGPVWALLTSGNGRLARWMRWGAMVSRWLPVVRAVLGKASQRG